MGRGGSSRARGAGVYIHAHLSLSPCLALRLCYLSRLWLSAERREPTEDAKKTPQRKSRDANGMGRHHFTNKYGTTETPLCSRPRRRPPPELARSRGGCLLLPRLSHRFKIFRSRPQPKTLRERTKKCAKNNNKKNESHRKASVVALH